MKDDIAAQIRQDNLAELAFDQHTADAGGLRGQGQHDRPPAKGIRSGTGVKFLNQICREKIVDNVAGSHLGQVGNSGDVDAGNSGLRCNMLQNKKPVLQLDILVVGADVVFHIYGTPD